MMYTVWSSALWEYLFFYTDHQVTSEWDLHIVAVHFCRRGDWAALKGTRKYCYMMWARRIYRGSYRDLLSIVMSNGVDSKLRYLSSQSPSHRALLMKQRCGLREHQQLGRSRCTENMSHLLLQLVLLGSTWACSNINNFPGMMECCKE